MPNLAASRLRELFSYDPLTGLFTRLVTAGGEVAGTIAGTKDNLGYVVFAVDGVSHKAHRLAWLYVNGRWPDGHLDHKDASRANNRISNLRPATRSQNKANSRRYANNTSGFKGVSLYKPSGKWLARIRSNNKIYHLGYFDKPETAYAAYVSAAHKLHGEFARVA